MKSTLALNQITVIDCAYIDHEGNVVGGSYQPNFIVSGEMDPVEKVVVDFSTIKKDIKVIIDDKETGWDHKLWIVDGFSKVNLVDTYWSPEENQFRVTIKTPTLELSMPRNALTVIHSGDIDLELAKYVQTELAKKYPNINIGVEATCTTVADICSFNNIEVSEFRYFHGLKDSTSWGCQNIAHGHLSFIQLDAPEEAFEEDVLSLQTEIADSVSNVGFINEENVIEVGPDFLSIGYTTGRGEFYAKYDTTAHELIVLETETTVEYLAEFVGEMFNDQMKELGVTRMFISEGLSKGAIYYVK